MCDLRYFLLGGAFQVSPNKGYLHYESLFAISICGDSIVGGVFVRECIPVQAGFSFSTARRSGFHAPFSCRQTAGRPHGQKTGGYG